MTRPLNRFPKALNFKVTLSWLGSLGFASFIALLAFSPGARAADVQRIAAIVNDEIISEYDLELRIDLVMRLTRGADDPMERRRIRDQVLRGLVDEKLQIQEAHEHEVSVTENEIREALMDLGRQNNLPRDEFRRFLASLGSAQTSLEHQIHAEIAWNMLLRRTMRVQVGDEEVESILERLKASAGQFEYFISEIFLISDSPARDEEVRQTALRLIAQIMEGSPFQAVARQFSDAPTAATGGQVGWVQQGQLTEEVEVELPKLRVGALSEPIKSSGGYYVVQLQDRRRILSADPRDTQLTLKQILVPVAEGTSQDKLEAMRRGIVSVSAEITDCQQVADKALAMGTKEYGDIGTLRAGDLPDAIRESVLSTEVGRASPVIFSGDSFRLLVVCDRKDPEVRLPSHDDVANNLYSQRLSMMARRYLRDLRRDAIIDYRL